MTIRSHIWLLEGPSLTIYWSDGDGRGLPAAEVFIEPNRETWPVLAERSFRSGKTWLLPSVVITPRREDEDPDGDIIGVGIYSELLSWG